MAGHLLKRKTRGTTAMGAENFAGGSAVILDGGVYGSAEGVRLPGRGLEVDYLVPVRQPPAAIRFRLESLAKGL